MLRKPQRLQGRDVREGKSYTVETRDVPASNRKGKVKRPGSAATFPLLVVAIALALKGLFLFIDAHPMLYLGDSASYLRTALTGWIPGDRSFTYGFFLRLAAVWPQSLGSLVILQTLAGVVSSLGLAFILNRFFKVRSWLILVFVGLSAVDPAQLLFERHVMTETLCLLLLAASLTLLLLYLENPDLSRLVGFQLLALGLISMRISWLPFVILASVLVPTAGVLWRKGSPAPIRLPGLHPRLRKSPIPGILLHLLISISVLFVCHGLYRSLKGDRVYLREGGYFLLAAWAPIVKPEDAPDQLSREVLGEPSQFEIGDPYQRQHQRWAPGGLITRLRERFGGYFKSNQAAREMAYRAALRDPLGVLRLGWLLYESYWHSELYLWAMDYDFDHRPLPQHLSSILRTHFRLEASDFSQPTRIEQYYRRARPWFMIVLLSPLLCLLALCLLPPAQRTYAGVLFLASVVGLSSICLFVLYPSLRYLHQLSWITLLTAPIIIDRLLVVIIETKTGSSNQIGSRTVSIPEHPEVETSIIDAGRSR